MLSNLLIYCDLIYCTSLDAFRGTTKPADPKVHLARPHPGQICVAKRIRQIMENSEILTSHVNCDKVQDPYSFRCVPQVHGAVYEAFLQFQDTLRIELNSATDNPLVFPSSENADFEIISQGNFHGEILALNADKLSLAIFELASISERRMDQLLIPIKVVDLLFGCKQWLESGLMIVSIQLVRHWLKCTAIVLLELHFLPVHLRDKKTM